MALGVNPGRIVYAHPCKPPKEIRWAATHGINLTTFDTESELHKVGGGKEAGKEQGRRNSRVPWACMV